MAIKEKPAEKKLDQEMVDFYAMRDSGKYRDDIFVGVNGKTFKIKRGVRVRIPRYVAEVLTNSMDQTAKAALFMEQAQADYDAASFVLG